MASLSLSSTFRSPEIPRPRKTLINNSKHHPNPPLISSSPLKTRKNRSRISATSATPTAPQQIRNPPSDLVTLILSKVVKTDRGVLLSNEEHKKVAQVAEELGKFCVDQPVKSPLIFGEWDVVYCSNPTSPGGGYRSAFGRLVFKTNEMVQTIEAPDTVKNRVSLSAFGFLDGEVSLKGKLKVSDDKWIQVVFEPPQLSVGALDFQYGFESEVKLEITYIDEKIRLGKGSRGSLFVFKRRE